MHNLNILYILTIQGVIFRQMVGLINNLGQVHRKNTIRSHHLDTEKEQWLIDRSYTSSCDMSIFTS